MSRRTTTRHAVLAIAAFGALALLAPAGASAAAPAWRLNFSSTPTNLVPGTTSSNFPNYALIATNVGGERTEGPVTVTFDLPEGLTAVSPRMADHESGFSKSFACSVAGQTVTCTDPNPIYPSRWVYAVVGLEVSSSIPDPSVLSASASISGGEAPPASASLE